MLSSGFSSWWWRCSLLDLRNMKLTIGGLRSRTKKGLEMNCFIFQLRAAVVERGSSIHIDHIDNAALFSIILATPPGQSIGDERDCYWI